MTTYVFCIICGAPLNYSDDADGDINNFCKVCAKLMDAADGDPAKMPLMSDLAKTKIAESNSRMTALEQTQIRMGRIPVSLVFDDWRQAGKSVYQTDQGVALSSGSFH